MKLLARRPDGTVTRVNLDALPIWRLGLAPVAPCDLGIVISYPSGQGMSNSAMLSVGFPNQAMELLKRLPSVLLTTGTLEGDKERTAEALKELVNLEVRPAMIPELTEACQKLVENYWKIRDSITKQETSEYAQGGWQLAITS